MRRLLILVATGTWLAAACDHSEIVATRFHADAGLGGEAGAEQADGGAHTSGRGGSAGSAGDRGGADNAAGAATASTGGEGGTAGSVGGVGAASGAGVGAGGDAGAGPLDCMQSTPVACPGTVLLGGLPTAPVGGSPRGLASLGDYDGDGSLDVAYADDGLDGAGVLLGVGDGTFLPAKTFPTGENPRSIQRAFLDAGTTQDLVVANFDSDNVSVLLGNGDGTFKAAVSYALGAGGKPIAVRAATMNNDAKQDLVVINYSGNNVNVLLGNGDGTFNPTPITSFGVSNPVAFAVVETNGSINDLVVANNLGLTVLLGTGTGAFQPPTHIPLGYAPVALATGFLNADTFVDVVVTLGPNQATLPLKVLLGKGDGTFQAPVDYFGGAALTSAIITDLNADAKQDVVVGSSSSVGQHGSSVDVFFGNGDGTLQPAQQLLAGRSPVAFASNDVNHDGKNDLVTAYDSLPANYSSFDIGVTLGHGDGTFAVPGWQATADAPEEVTFADLNHDCLPDLAVATATGQAVSVLIAKAGGGYEPAVDYALGAVAAKVLLADFTGDGEVDLQATTTGGTYRLLGKGDGTFDAPVPLGGSGAPRDMVSADFNGDQRLDTALLSGSNDGCLSVNLGGAATWSSCYAIGAFPTAVGAADLNGDQLLDLLTADSGSAQLSLLLGKGDGTFQAAVAHATGLPAGDLVLGDLDGDKDVDVVTTGDDKVRVLFNDGAANFGNPIEYATRAYSVSNLVLADVDADGSLDILATNRLANQLVLLPNQGTGSFGSARSYVVGTDPYGLAAGDFDRDGDVDVAVAARTGNGITLLQSVGCATWPPQ